MALIKQKNSYNQGLDFEDYIFQYLPKNTVRNKTIRGKYFTKNVDFFIAIFEEYNVIIEAKSISTNIRPYIYDLIARVALNFPESINICCLESKKEIKESKKPLGDLLKTFDFIIPKEKIKYWINKCIRGIKPKNYDSYWLETLTRKTINGKYIVEQAYFEPIIKFISKSTNNSSTQKKISERFNLNRPIVKKILNLLREDNKIFINGRTIILVEPFAIFLKSKNDLKNFIISLKKPIQIKELRKKYIRGYRPFLKHLKELELFYIKVGGKILSKQYFNNYLSKMKNFAGISKISYDLGLNHSNSLAIRNILEDYTIKGIIIKDKNGWYFKN